MINLPTLFESCAKDKKKEKEIDRIYSLELMSFKSPIDMFIRLRK